MLQELGGGGWQPLVVDHVADGEPDHTRRRRQALLELLLERPYERSVNQHTEAQKRHAESRHIPPREASAKRERPHESGGSARHT